MGVERVIEAVDVDSNRPDSGAAALQAQQFQQELQQITPETHLQGSNWYPSNAPSQAVTWAVQALAKAGTLSIIGVYPPKHHFFPLGMAMNKNLTVNMGNCNYRKYTFSCW